MELTADEAALLRGLTAENHREGRPANVHKARVRDALCELHRKGLITVSACRTGLFIDEESWWVRITDDGRVAVSEQRAASAGGIVPPC